MRSLGLTRVPLPWAQAGILWGTRRFPSHGRIPCGLQAKGSEKFDPAPAPLAARLQWRFAAFHFLCFSSLFWADFRIIIGQVILLWACGGYPPHPTPHTFFCSMWQLGAFPYDRRNTLRNFSDWCFEIFRHWKGNCLPYSWVSCFLVTGFLQNVGEYEWNFLMEYQRSTKPSEQPQNILSWMDFLIIWFRR